MIKTGAQHIEMLRDGRQVYINGQPAGDVSVHPAFRRTIQSIGALYDFQARSDNRDLMTFEIPEKGHLSNPLRSDATSQSLKRLRHQKGHWRGWPQHTRSETKRTAPSYRSEVQEGGVTPLARLLGNEFLRHLLRLHHNEGFGPFLAEAFVLGIVDDDAFRVGGRNRQSGETGRQRSRASQHRKNGLHHVLLG